MVASLRLLALGSWLLVKGAGRRHPRRPPSAVTRSQEPPLRCCRDHSELDHQAQVVLIHPDLRDLAVTDAEDVDALILDAIAGGRRAQELALVRAGDDPADGHLVAVGHLPVDREL